MTQEEKFWQLYMIPGDLSEGKEKFKNGIFGLQLNTKARSNNAAEQMLNYENSGSAESEAKEINDIQKYFTSETRLDIPIIPFDEALHGLIRPGATAFPQSIGLAASFDTISNEECCTCHCHGSPFKGDKAGFVTCDQYCTRCAVGKNRRNLW